MSTSARTIVYFTPPSLSPRRIVLGYMDRGPVNPDGDGKFVRADALPSPEDLGGVFLHSVMLMAIDVLEHDQDVSGFLRRNCSLLRLEEEDLVQRATRLLGAGEPRRVSTGSQGPLDWVQQKFEALVAEGQSLRDFFEESTKEVKVLDPEDLKRLSK